MEIKRSSKMIVPFLIGLIVVIVLSGCTRSKSSPTVAVGTPAGEAGFSIPTAASTQGMGLFENTATPEAGHDTGAVESTATAAPVEGQEPAATATPEAVQPVEVSKPVVEATPVPALVATQVLPTAGPNPATYTLQKGEHPFCIARRYNVDQYELLSVNGLSNGSVLAPGAVLKLPTTGNPFVSQRALKVHPAQYKVAAGETIYSIACAFGDVRPESIAAANNLAAPFTLTSGTVLNIP